MTLELAIRAAALLGLGLLLARALAPAAAATRHALWCGVMCSVLLLPALGLLAPAWSVVDRERLPGLSFLLSKTTAAPDVTSLTVPVRGEGGAAARPPRAGLAMGAATATWLLGAVAIAAYYLCGYLSLWRLGRRSTPAPLPWNSSVARLATRSGLRAVPEVRLSPSVPGPVVAGLLRSTILIPPEAASWADARRDAVLVHELAHIRRRDLHAQVAAHAVCALHWFNPLAWLAAAAMRLERERACDDEVIGAGMAPADYASELLAIAAASFGRAAAAALPMARPSQMEGRVRSLLGRRPRRMGRFARAGVPVLVMTASVALAGAKVSPAPESPGAPAAERASRPPWIEPAPSGDEWPTAAVSEAALSPDASVRERRTLVLALTPGARVVPALLQALGDADSGVREKAAVGLAWRRDARIVPALIEAASDPERQVREKVLVALAFSGDQRARAVIEAARHDPDPRVRDKAETLALLP